MMPQEAVDQALHHCLVAEQILDTPDLPTELIALSQVHATLAEAYARIASATVVLATSEHHLEERRIAAVAGIPGVRA